MKRWLLTVAIICLFFIPKQAQCQFDRAKATQMLLDAINRHESGKKSPETSYAERMADRQEAMRQREIQNQIDAMSEYQLLNHLDDFDYRYRIIYYNKERLISALSNSWNILDYYKNDDLRKIIMENPTLMENVKNVMWSQKERILDFARDPHLNQLIMSDPLLNKYYYLEEKKQRMVKEGVKIDDIKDPEIRNIVINNPSLMDNFNQNAIQQAQKDLNDEIKRTEDELNEQNRIKINKKNEEVRKQGENERANIQVIKNENERKENKQIQDELSSSPFFVQLPDVSSLISDLDALKITKPIDIFGINYTDDLSTKGDDKLKIANQGNKTTNNDDNLYDQSYLEQKWDGIKYDAKDNLYKINKQFEISKKEFSTKIKKIPDNARRKVEAVPITWVENKTKNIVNFAYPGAEMYETSKVQIKSGKEQVKLFEGVLSCISDAVDAGVSGKFDIFECINPSVKVFTDEQLSNTESLTHMKIRRYIPFLKKSKINENEE